VPRIVQHTPRGRAWTLPPDDPEAKARAVAFFRLNRRLRLGRGESRCAVSAAARGSFYVPAPGCLACMCGRPVGCKGLKENADGLVGCEHVSGLLTRRHVRWPRWGPRPSPKQFCGFESRHANRVLWISVRPIVISFSSFTPASTRASDGDRRTPVLVTRVIATHAGWAISLLNHVRIPEAVRSPAVPKGRDRQSPAMPRPLRCPADCRAVHPARRHILLESP
jgi:hypothetical protein